MLLRASGVPSRYVNGFLGGEWNEIGHYVAVRENRAHSWAEAYMGELGWMRVDATPPNRALFRMGRLRQIFDSIDFFWGRWVVGYDLGRQIELARRLGHGLGGSPDDGDPRPWKFPWGKSVAVAGGVVALALGWRLMRRSAPVAPGGPRAWAARGGGPPVARLYEKALRSPGAPRAAPPPVGDAARVRRARRCERRHGQRCARAPDRALYRRAFRGPGRRRRTAARAGGAPAGARSVGGAGGIGRRGTIDAISDRPLATAQNAWHQLPKWRWSAWDVARRSNLSPRPATKPTSPKAPPLQLLSARLLTRVFTHRLALALGTLLLASGLARTASAQTGLGGATGTSALAASDLLIVVQSTPGVALPDFDLQRFFNVANCECNTPVSVFFTFSQSGFAKKATLGQGTIEFYVGLNCNNISVRNCQKLGDTLTLTTFGTNSGVVVNTDTQTLSQNFGQPGVTTTTNVTDGGVVVGDGGTVTGGCGNPIAFSQTIWALVTFTGDTPYDVSATLPIAIDTAPPPDPTGFAVSAGNEALITSWTGLDTAVTTDLLGYQLLCDRGGQLQVFKTGSFGAGFRTCPTATFPPGLDSHINGLDPAYVCSPLLTQISDSYRIKILQNDITYGVSVVAIDTHYNASVPDVWYMAPQRTLSFYDVYRNGDETNTGPNGMPDPGKATGGFCAVAGHTSRRAGAAGLAIAVAIVAFGLTARRRRRSARR